MAKKKTISGRGLSSRKATPNWKQFEIAVADFIKANAPNNAEIIPNARLPDKHVKRVKRQRDVWIKTKALNLYNIIVLVSCKRYRRKLHISDIEHFDGERRNSTAHVGVIYSYSGFAESAIEKAKALGITCCGLFNDRAKNLPAQLFLKPFYCFSGRISLTIDNYMGRGVTTWQDIYDLRIDDNGEHITMLDLIEREYKIGEAAELKRSHEPPISLVNNWVKQLAFDVGEEPPLIVQINGGWRVEKADAHCVLMNGHYNFTTGQFQGEQIFPMIDLHSTTRGPDWAIAERPKSLDDCSLAVVLYAGKVRDGLLTIADTPLPQKPAEKEPIPVITEPEPPSA